METPARRKRRWPRIVLWAMGSLAALLLAAAVAGVLWLRTVARAALPQLDGQIRVAGLSAPVTVQRDAHGVPHIEAARQEDLWLAQGYVTAQDRLWQMDLYRRFAQGGLAEILGPALLKRDEAQRVLEIRNTAQRIYAQLDPADRARLDAYARGVNLFIAQHEDRLPPEFRLLAYRPRPWSGVDSVSVGLMMVQDLDTHWMDKLSRGRIASRLHDPRLEADLYPVGSWRDRPPTGEVRYKGPKTPVPMPAEDDDDDTEVASAAGAAGNGRPAGAETQTLLARLGLPQCDGCVPGSNEWVVAGAHTAGGKPLLSNDMHLSLTAPNIWYMADLRAPGFHAAGVTLPGLPFVIAGHNEHVAWGFTALMGDVQDLYEEKLDGKGHYQGADGAWRPLQVDRETIHVRGRGDVSFTVQLTDHGPLLNPMLEHETRPIALKWTLYDPALHEIPLYAMDAAGNWKEFAEALSAWCWPTQNVVYSDDQGHIAYHAVGQIPARAAGLAGVPIADAAHEWHGYIPFDNLPGVMDPPSGFLATANARVTTEKSRYPLTLDWVSPYRVQRIYKALEGRDGLTREDMLAVQTDIYSEVDQELGQRFAYAILHTPGVDGQLRQAAALLRAWDGRLTTNSAAASLVTETRRALWPMILKPKLGTLAEDYHWEESSFAEEEMIMRGKQEWLPPGYRNWNALLTDAVRHALEEGNAPADVARWRYGNWHTIDVEHPLAPFLPLLSRVAGTGPQPMSGDTTTVKQVGRSFGPSQRFTMDWSNIDASTENIVLGESGNPLSPYYRDQWSDWYDGTTFALPFTPPAVAAQTRHTLRLTP